MSKGNGLVVIGMVHRADSTSPQKERSLRMLYGFEFSRQPVRLIGEFDRESSANVAHARCAIVRDFLAHPRRPEWLWLLDSDMTFNFDILEQLISAADAQDRPLMGGLCFGVRPQKGPDGSEHFNETGGTSLELFPTIYVLDDAGKMHHAFGYPQDEVVPAHSTGAACLLINRRVLGDPEWVKDGHPLPWFREAVMRGIPVSEDQFFCLRAGALGYPLHINTAARTGHVKTFVADEDLFLAQRAAMTRQAPPEPVEAAAS
jgi:hypothetical protein